MTTHTTVHTFWACYLCPASGETYTAADKHTRYTGHPTTTGTTAEVVARVAERYRAIAAADAEYSQCNDRCYGEACVHRGAKP